MVSAPDPAVTRPGVQSRWPHLPEPRSRKCQARRRRRGPTARVAETALGDLACYSPGAFPMFLVSHSKTKRPQTKEEAAARRGRTGEPAAWYRAPGKRGRDARGRAVPEDGCSPCSPSGTQTPPAQGFLRGHVSAEGDLALRSLGFPKSPVTSSHPPHLLCSPTTAKSLS